MHRLRRKAEQRLVEQQQARLGQGTARDCQLALLTPAQRSGPLLKPVAEHGKQLRDWGECVATTSRWPSQGQVLRDCQRREEAAIGRHMNDATPRPLVGGHPTQFAVAIAQHARLRRDQPGDGVQECGLAGR